MGTHKILVVDDSKTDLANLEGILSAAGCSVLTSTNGSEAIAMAKAERPELIFLDIIMPEMDGYEACRRLAQDAETKDIPVVFVSSKNQRADRVWGMMQGAKDLVSKPYCPDDILAHVGLEASTQEAEVGAPPAPDTAAEARQFMLDMLGAFTSPVRTRALAEAIASADGAGALESLIAGWQDAIAENPNGLAEVGRLRKTLDGMLGG